MDPADLKHRFEFHPATDEEKRNDHTSVRMSCLAAAERIDVLCPDGREKAVAITKLEEAMFWANAALARQVARLSVCVLCGETYPVPVELHHDEAECAANRVGAPRG